VLVGPHNDSSLQTKFSFLKVYRRIVPSKYKNLNQNDERNYAIMMAICVVMYTKLYLEIDKDEDLDEMTDDDLD
jgi:hypothetical protein